jgi:hypothetical protein
MHLGKICCGLAMVLTGSLLPAIAEEDQAKKRYRGGQIRAGVFWVQNIDTKLMVTPADIPIGVRIATSKDLGLAESNTVPRLMLSYRFSRRHRLDFGWYGLNRDGVKSLGRDIEFKDTTYQIGTEVESYVKTDLYKLAYTWIFHEDEKVTLGASAGLHTTSFDIGIAARGEIVPLNEEETLTAPLPVVGGRLVYRITPRLSALVAVDWFFINYDAYQGSMADFFTIFEHRATKHFGVGGGINLFNLSVIVEDSEINADIRHTFSGAVFYLSFYF